MNKLHSTNNLIHHYRVYKALIAANYAGKSVSVDTVQSANEKFFNKLPLLDTPNGFHLFEDNGIAYYLSNDALRGDSELSQASVVQWLCWAQSDFWPSVFAWVLPAVGLSDQKQTMEQAKNDVKILLKQLNEHLLSRTYLVGERITLADIAVAITLLPLYQHVLELPLREQYGNVTRYFMTLVNQDHFLKVLGKVELCSGVKQIQSGGDAGVKEKQSKKQPAPKKPEPEDDADDDLIPATPNPKDPFEKFPRGKFNMDDFKRFYSNNSEDKSIPYFWEKFDKENYSIWYCEYKYPEELTQVFMSCNLIGGMFQRLDRMRKNAFANVLLFGEDNNSTISGVWVWRGHELAFPLSEDWTIDYESYSWKKLDPDDEATKKMVKEYFSWEGEFDGKKFNQGKTFK